MARPRQHLDRHVVGRDRDDVAGRQPLRSVEIDPWLAGDIPVVVGHVEPPPARADADDVTRLDGELGLVERALQIIRRDRRAQHSDSRRHRAPRHRCRCRASPSAGSARSRGCARPKSSTVTSALYPPCIRSPMVKWPSASMCVPTCVVSSMRSRLEPASFFAPIAPAAADAAARRRPHLHQVRRLVGCHARRADLDRVAEVDDPSRLDPAQRRKRARGVRKWLAPS